MNKRYKFIFDMDGTLYRFDKGKGQTFTASRFYTDLKSNVYGFFMERRGFSRNEAMTEYERIKDTYDGEISLGVEREYEIDRYEYFNNTWNLNPANYIEKDKELPEMLELIRGQIVLLTAAPLIWAKNVLAYLNVEMMFENNLYTGEPDMRKPNPAIFQKIANDLSLPPKYIFSIGDQGYSDITPAKSIGMRTMLIGVSQNTIADYQANDVKSAINLLKKEGLI